ncbi:MAG: DUF6152 family protein [Terriglobia bacterium]
MKPWILSIAIGIGAVLAAQAHHSISALYDTGKQVTLEGTISQFQFVQPHPFLMIEGKVKDAGGNAQSWRLEMDNLRELAEVGMTSQTLKPGDHVLIKGNPGREHPQTLYIRRLDRGADGFWYEQVGSSPRTSIVP